MALLCLLLLFALQPESGTYPPDGVMLIQSSGTVQLRWQLPGKKYHLRVEQNSHAILDEFTSNSTTTLLVARQQPVTWRVTNESGGSTGGSFSVPFRAEIRADGLKGHPREYRYGGGRPGGAGGQIHLRLQRDANGMNLWADQPGPNHYLFSQPGMRLFVSARGGNGGNAPRVGFYATSGGNGGVITIRTSDAPWRDYLDLDFGAGKAGLDCWGKSDSKEASDGKPGKVVTLIEP